MARLSLLLLLLLCSFIGLSQETAKVITASGKDMIAYTEKAQKEYLEKTYSLLSGVEDGVVNGRTYFPYHYRSKNKPLLFFEKDRTASITMNGRKYEKIIPSV